MKTFTYHINLDERGEFYADVRDVLGATIYEIDTPAMSDLMIDGFMSDTNDAAGLRDHLESLGFMSADDELVQEA